MRLHHFKLCAEAIGQLFMANLATARTTDSWGPHLGSGPVFQMLAGLALENLVKAALVKKLDSDFQGKRIPRWIEGHNLVKLFEKAGIDLLSSEEDFLQRLSECVIWAGRYPVPKRIEDMAVGHETSDSDVEEFRKLFALLESALEADLGGSQ